MASLLPPPPGDVAVDAAKLAAQAKKASAAQLYASLPVPNGTRTIRLLDLEPPKRDWKGFIVDRHLTGRLRTARLEDSPSFCALSYVWGPDSANPERQIRCLPDGPDLDITTNCHAALKQIQRRFAPVTIWIDSICINQDDDKEKESQIPLMREIYTWATTVYIWLGNGTPASDAAIRMIKWCSLGYDGSGAERELNRLKSVDKLFRREWFHRSWTFQEVILATNPLILCGNKSLKWGCMLNVLYGRGERSPRSKWPRGLVNWRLVTDGWIAFPRPQNWNGVHVRATEPPDGQHEPQVLSSGPPLQLYRQLRRRTRLCHAFFWLSGLLGWGWTTYAMAIKAIAVGISKTEVWFAVACGWLSLTFCFVHAVVSFERHVRISLNDWTDKDSIGWHVNISSDQSSATDTHDLVVGGIYAALRHRKSQRPHDQAFAITGILSSLGSHLPPLSYDMAPAEVYRTLTEYLIARDPAYVALLVDAAHNADTDAPSWVPDWHNPPCPWLTFGYAVGKTVFNKVHTASLPRLMSNKLMTNGGLHGTVNFKGIIPTGIVDSTAPPITPQWFKTVIEWFKFAILRETIIPNVHKAAYDTPQSHLYAVLRGLSPVRGPTGELHRYEDEFGRRSRWEEYPLWKGPYDFTEEKEDFKKFMKIYSRALKRLHRFRPWAFCNTDDTGFIPATVYHEIRGIFDAYELMARLASAIIADKRCLFTLSTGLIGSGPLGMELGDEVYTLQGVPAPMVLRKLEDGTFVVVGAALVHGLMHGEGRTDGQEVILA
ncbi:heterokaryon incompatibility protein-domain-containing protein [Podospora aff. communis PSN243]|uniref:Heterokaryon incompatibility protein-domain-containing protein n=1 Tax=Podospora aff. communis PSN243 TaxID=3040156 RepID=A0AAV9G4M3_9PEZI|nr:heterokaryon incompatibility protein-domain-containing protein [Podospora aff. communis PSN243]